MLNKCNSKPLMTPTLKLALRIYLHPTALGGMVGIIHGVASSANSLWTLPFKVVSHGLVGIMCGAFWPFSLYYREKIKTWI